MVSLSSSSKASGSSSRNSFAGGLPPPQASSTPKKRHGKPNGFGFFTPPSKTKSGERNAEGSPLKKRKVAYMDEYEDDHGETLAVNGRTMVLKQNGHGHEKKKSNTAKEIQEQRANLPITKGSYSCILLSVMVLLILCF